MVNYQFRFSVTMSSEIVKTCTVICSAQTLNAVFILVDSREQKQVNDSVFVLYELLKTRSLPGEKSFLKIQSGLTFYAENVKLIVWEKKGTETHKKSKQKAATHISI